MTVPVGHSDASGRNIGISPGVPLATPGEFAIEATDITKAYGAILALDGVNFRAAAGKVTVLLGENGAGKSTLMRILAGETIADSGQIVVRGTPVRLRSPRDARHHGIALIHQELSLFPDLSVAANIFAGREHRRGAIIDDRKHLSLATQILARLDRRVDPRALARSLSVGQQQVVEIAKALVDDARVVIMDEPTSALSNAEVDALFAIIRDLTSRNVAVIYISHRMDEIFRIGDDLVVFRDGRTIASAAARDVNMEWVSERMLGSRERTALRQMSTARPQRQAQSAAVALEVENVTLAHPDAQRLLLDNVSFRLEAGEVLGVYGLLGAGKTELAETVAGLRPTALGTCRVAGVVAEAGPAARIRAGIAFVPEDRQRQALFPAATVSQNIALTGLANLSTAGVISARREDSAVRRLISELSIRVRSGAASIMSLSGGNQQKTIIARALLIKPRILVLDEPTRGIDVGAKAEIFHIMRRLAGEGIAVFFSSSELPEIMAVSDRILVLSRGRVRAVFNASQATEDDIIRSSADDRTN
jgi:erythritol transport system ATP-binding protein